MKHRTRNQKWEPDGPGSAIPYYDEDGFNPFAGIEVGVMGLNNVDWALEGNRHLPRESSGRPMWRKREGGTREDS